MVVAISEKRCGFYMHLSKKNDYNEAPEALLILLTNAKTLDIKPNLGDETPKLMWAPMGKLVPQLPGIVNFSYDLRFRHVTACCKGLLERYTLHHQTLTPFTI